PRGAVVLDRPVGQWLANLRRPGALEGRPEWARALREVDPDWNPHWPADWQRHFAALRDLVGVLARTRSGAAALAGVEPGVTAHGLDVGRWLARQREYGVWRGLAEGQRARLAGLGVAAPAPPRAAAAPRRRGAGAFERGVSALAQYRAREERLTVPRGHVEELADGTRVRLGVWLSNTRARRSALTDDQRARLAGLGLEWAV
ncbi:helicase associated domain-containing protein, partial [Streptomyces sp. ODS05-4]|uniref:helicase associated domain-containing protein n=1 Tax=Streptomyces sp. ODS05-4 TaxID=2944939 RepID=UPI00210B28F0